MAQVKIFGNTDYINSHQNQISELIKIGLFDVLQIPKSKSFQRFIPLMPTQFIYPAPRSENYIILEIYLMTGRSKQRKKALINYYFELFEKELGLNPIDLEIMLVEIPPENFGFRGMTGDEAQLNYPVVI